MSEYSQVNRAMELYDARKYIPFLRAVEVMPLLEVTPLVTERVLRLTESKSTRIREKAYQTSMAIGIK